MIQVVTRSTALTNGDVVNGGFQPQADTWVKLRDRPTPYSDDEALLLCETAEGLWIGWVGDFGQITLQPGEFYRLD